MLVRFDYPRTFDHVVNDFFTGTTEPVYAAYPAINITDHEHETIVQAELPGVNKEDVNVQFENNVLRLSGKRNQNKVQENANVVLNEIRERNFSRSIKFEAAVETAKIQAELTNGILHITLPKAEEAKPKQIEIIVK